MDAENKNLRDRYWQNKILSYGDNFAINDYPFQYAAMRKKMFNENTLQDEKHKKAGDKIGNNAPATLVVLLDSV